jgi:LmbE family N-acetylglucosaminyl deacetylase
MPRVKSKEVDPKLRKKRAKRRLFVYGGIIAVVVAVYDFQPIEVDFIPRHIPKLPKVDPDSKKLFAKGTRIMVVTAHPDDSEFYIAGTLLRLHQSGAELRHLLHTDGDKAYYFWADNSSLRATRRDEQSKASGEWGAREIRFLGYPDGRLRNNSATVEDTANAIRQWEPSYILCFDGDYPPRASHQDHRRSGDITVAAARRAGFRGWLLMYNTQAPNFVVDTDAVWSQRLAILADHASQFSGEKLKRIQDFRTQSEVEEGEIGGFSFGEAFRAIKL